MPHFSLFFSTPFSAPFKTELNEFEMRKGMIKGIRNDQHCHLCHHVNYPNL